MNVTGLQDFSLLLSEIPKQSIGVMNAAVYAGAGVVIEAVKEEIRALPVEEGYMKDGYTRHTVKRFEKEELLEHVGISPISVKDGVVSAAVGFDGYTKNTTKKFPSGIPIPLLARSIVSGSSVRDGTPFLRVAVNKSKKAAQEAMKAAAEAKIKEITK